MSEPLDLHQVMQVARAAAFAGGKAALHRWRRGVVVETKPDDSPVTRADREAEEAILETITRAFPDHAVLAEESGERGEPGRPRWIVDPLDGTRGFVRGGSSWGPLVALEADGEIVAGAAGVPALDLWFWAARGQGCFAKGQKVVLSEVTSWEEATVSVGEMKALFSGPHRERVLGTIARAASARCYGDVLGAALLLLGQADAWVEGGVKLWDLAALSVLVEEAGGTFTDLDGRRDLSRGEALATNGRLGALPAS